MNIHIYIIINMHIEDYMYYLLLIRFPLIGYSLLAIPYWVFRIGYSPLAIPERSQVANVFRSAKRIRIQPFNQVLIKIRQNTKK